MQSNIGGNNSGQANKATIWFIVGFIVLIIGGLVVAGIYSSGS